MNVMNEPTDITATERAIYDSTYMIALADADPFLDAAAHRNRAHMLAARAVVRLRRRCAAAVRREAGQ